MSSLNKSYKNYTTIIPIKDTDSQEFYSKWLHNSHNIRYEYIDDNLDTEINVLSQRLLSIDSEEKAMKFIENSLSYMTYTEIIKCFYNLSKKEIKHYKKTYRKARKSKSNQEAGAIDADKLGPIILGNDIYIYKFLLVMDTIHDFKIKKRAYINGEKQQWFEATLPDNIKTYLNDYIYWIPKDCSIEEIMDEEVFIEKLSKLETLFFISNDNAYIEIANPFYKIDISTFDISKFVDRNEYITYNELLTRNINSTNKLSNNKTFSVELFVSQTTKKSALKLEDEHIYKLFSYINILGGNNDITEFQSDNLTDQFNSLFFSLSYIQKTLQDFLFYSEKPRGFLINNQFNLEHPIGWILKYCDANIYDPMKNKIHFDSRDERPTECVYDSRIVHYQVFLDGARRIVPDPNHRYAAFIKPETNVTIMDLSYNETYNIDENEAETFSINSIKTIVDNKQNNFIKQNPKEIKDKLVRFNLDTIFGLKRAGDWSQVEHAKKYGKVFLTSDRYAALYAYFRKVPTILYRTAIETDLEYFNIVDREDYPNFAQYSFIIMDPNRP